MLSTIFHTLIYDPLYNGLVFFVDIVPGHDMGLAVIALTVVVRVLILPLSRRAVQAQLAMRKIAPEVEKLKEKYKKDREEQTKQIFALYKKENIHPFASLGLVLIQLPILFALYFVFYKSGFPDVDTSLLYSFVHIPTAIDMQFLGLVDMGGKSIVLGVLAGVTQFIYTRLSMGPRVKALESSPVEASLSSDMAKSFDLQARYVFPLIIGVLGCTIPSAAPLYWATSNTFMIAQEYLSGRRFAA